MKKQGDRVARRAWEVILSGIVACAIVGTVMAAAPTPAVAGPTSPGTITTVSLFRAQALRAAPDGSIWFSGVKANAQPAIVRYDPSSDTEVTRVAPTPGQCTSEPDPNSKFCGFAGLDFTSTGRLYFGEDAQKWYNGLFTRSARIWDQDLNRIAGTGAIADYGDGGPAVDASLRDPDAVAVGPDFAIYFTEGNRIRRIDRFTGVITNFAGSNTEGYAGDGGPAIDAQFDGITDLDFDHAGNLYVADRSNFRVRRIAAGTTQVSTVAGNGSPIRSGDGGPALDSGTAPNGVTVDSQGNLYIAGNDVVRMVNTAGVITTIAGNGTEGYSGDGGPATEAQLDGPRAVAVDAGGDIYVADGVNGVRRIEALATPTSGAINGRVIDGGGTGVAGLYVSVLADWPSWSAVATTTTGASGSFTVAGLPAGTYRVRYWDPTGAHPRTWHSGAVDYRSATPVEVSAGTVAAVYDTVGSETAGVTGRVTDDTTGDPLPGLTVMVLTDSGWVAGATTGPLGFFWIGALQPGDYYLRFIDGSGAHLAEWHSDGATFAQADLASLAAGVTRIDAALTPSPD